MTGVIAGSLQAVCHGMRAGTARRELRSKSAAFRAPERPQLELDSVERTSPHSRVAVVLLDLLEASGFERQHFERPTQRIDEPCVRNAFTRVDA